jgi:hypothetical protein
MIQDTGLRFQWSRALHCSCRLNDDTDQWDPNCERCSGDGWLHVNPCAAEERHLHREYTEVRCIFSTVALHPTVTEIIGTWTMGSALLTVQNELDVGFHDKFTALDQRMAFSEVRYRLDQEEVPVGWKGRPRTIQRGAFRYEPIKVNYVEAEIGGVQTPYYAGEDFEVLPASATEPRKMRWLTGKGPPTEQMYVVHYVCHPVWVVEDAVYASQHAFGPARGLKGDNQLQNLPTTFKVGLEWLTHERGS